ncbi:PREDICTED: trypsin I-P1-like [Ceratosolen solmsi marchali]|uniref:Trypsin I-P1-like n=1 Tax=Ceratosolen solmsi marchali TaxID=326594 RepID=A0AAJ6YUS8_9HYME|nr:PREDICTED: trypsin I-P1-like [Ceratosolen solmsi marchali]
MDTKIIIGVYTVLIIGTLGKNVRIMGGQSLSVRECPYLVSIRNLVPSIHVCAGAIITNKHILTAGHCFYRRKKYEKLIINTGSSDLPNVSKTQFTIKVVNVHPEFYGKIDSPGDFLNDIAVITINECIEFDEFQNKIDLPTNDILFDTTVMLTGWDLTNNERKKYSDRVLQAPVKVMKISDCLKYFPFPIRNDCICTYANGISALKGDSGGPVTENNKIIGIISFSNSDVKNIPDVHINVYKHMQFIRSTIDTNLQCQ